MDEVHCSLFAPHVRAAFRALQLPREQYGVLNGRVRKYNLVASEPGPFVSFVSGSVNAVLAERLCVGKKGN